VEEGDDEDGAALHGWVRCTWLCAVSVGDGADAGLRDLYNRAVRDLAVEKGSDEAVKILDGH